MLYKLQKNSIFGCAILLLVVVAPYNTNTKKIKMSQITLKPLLVTEAETAHRVVFTGASPRMILGAMAKDKAALELFEVKGQTALPLTTIELLLPARLDFDLIATDCGEELIIAYEAHGGAISEVRVQPLGAKELLKLPSRKALINERRPRFVRGGGMAIVISENDEHAVYLEGGATPRRIELCTCLDAIAVKTTNGLAVVEKTLRPGAQVANIPPGGLTLNWPWRSKAEIPHFLFEGKDVFDYDAVATIDNIFIAAVTETGLEVIMVTPEKTEQSILVVGLPKYLEPFSPALSVSGKVLSIATLAKSPLHLEAPSSLFYGVYQW
jgi:hypothetical protein